MLILIYLKKSRTCLGNGQMRLVAYKNIMMWMCRCATWFLTSLTKKAGYRGVSHMVFYTPLD